MGFIFGPRTGHAALFADVCRFHNVDKKTRLMLKDIIEKLRLERPAELFIDSTLLQKAMQLPEYVDSDDIKALYKAWFGK